MEYTEFLTVKAYIFALKLGNPSAWIPLASELSVSLQFDGIRGPYCLSIEGVRVLLDSKITQNTEFKKKSKVFGYWMDEAKEAVYGIGFKTCADLVRFSETFSKMKSLSTSKKICEAEANIVKETRKSSTTEIVKNRTLASRSVASYLTVAAPEKDLNEQTNSKITTAKEYVRPSPCISTKYCLDIAKLTTQIREIQHSCKSPIKAVNGMISPTHMSLRDTAECQEMTIEYLNLCEKCTQEITNKEDEIKYLQQKGEDERCRKYYIQKLLNDQDAEITALREALSRNHQVDVEKENKLLIRMLQLHLKMEAKESEQIEESSVCELEKAVQPLPCCGLDLNRFYDEVESAIKDLCCQARTKCGTSSVTTEFD